MILLPIVLLGLATKVYSHGFVQEVVLGETSYPGYHPYVDPYQDPVPERIIRKIPGISPVEQLDWIDVQCNGESATGYYTEPAPLLGKIAAGDIIKFNWISYGGAKDNHHGPMLTYMAKVPEGRDVREWSPDTEKVWFKIDHSGKDSEGKWAATDRLNEANGTYTARIPPNLQPGQYLIRHEW
ncbi:hypothetical protein CC2G_013909 [Coprinopsis cinerea AmutBmut pab1-1]|nr:hypothetical protein CC2G_013909 [Coprinopsis cinerea AmutBmut pab1-1]